MKKAGILSMQRIYNYGSFLQAYALKKMMEECGAEVEFVDYHPGECILPSKETTGMKRKIQKGLEILRMKGRLRDKIQFVKYKKNYARKNYPVLGLKETYNYAPKLDLLVIGSDEVFNCIQDNSNVGFAPELFGAGHQADRLVSYAASFGNTTLESLKKYQVDEQVAQWLRAFDAISVRDDNSRKIVQELTGKDPVCHLDPVLVYDYPANLPETKAKIPQDPYMILYGYSGRFNKEEAGEIRKYAKRKGLKILCIGGIQSCGDKFIDCSPFEIFEYFKHAESVVTDTFHGTIFSVVTQKKFATFVRKNGYGNSEKLTDLLKRLGLERQIVTDTKKLGKILNLTVAYEPVAEKIKKERKRSYSYLKEMIEKDAEK